VLYTAGTLGSSLVAVGLLSALAERWSAAAPVELLRRAGRTTLSLYVLHVLVFRFVVDTHRWVGPTGLDTALVFAGLFWVHAVALAAVWLAFTPLGPVEAVYRRFGG
jgi:uncharacterized protein